METLVLDPSHDSVIMEFLGCIVVHTRGAELYTRKAEAAARFPTVTITQTHEAVRTTHPTYYLYRNSSSRYGRLKHVGSPSSSCRRTPGTQQNLPQQARHTTSVHPFTTPRFYRGSGMPSSSNTSHRPPDSCTDRHTHEGHKESESRHQHNTTHCFTSHPSQRRFIVSSIKWMTYLTGETASLSLQSMALGTLTPVDRKLPRWVALQFCDAPRNVPRNSDPVTSRGSGKRGDRPVLGSSLNGVPSRNRTDLTV